MGLERFLQAQEGMYDGAKAELGAGRKTSHWMWFVFPQAAGLGRSATAQFYAIDSMALAIAYAGHPVLGARLRQCAELLLLHTRSSAVEIMGPVDAMKLHSSMTLFQAAAPSEPSFGAVLKRFFGGTADAATLRILEEWRSLPDGAASGPGTSPDSVGQ